MMIPSQGFLQQPRSVWLLLCSLIGLGGLLYVSQAPALNLEQLLGLWAHALSTGILWALLWEKEGDGPSRILLSAAYALYGPFLWVASFDLQTALLIFSLMWGLLAYQRGAWLGVVLAGLLAGALRLDGATIALSLSLLFWFNRAQPRFLAVWPLLGIVLGAALYTNWATPAPQWAGADEHFWRIIGEWAGGYSEEHGWYQVPLLTFPATLSLGLALRTSWRIGRISEGLLLLFWLILMAWLMGASPAAFADFKRIQYPLLAMQYPLAGWLILRFDRQMPIYTSTIRTYMGLILAFSLISFIQFGAR